MLRCPECRAPYIGEAGHGRKEVYRYYVHRHYVGVAFKCRVRRFRADLVEARIVEHLNTFLQDQGYLAGIERNIESGFDNRASKAKQALSSLATELTRVESEIKGIFRVLPTMSEGPGVELAKTELDQLGSKKIELVSKKKEAESSLLELEEKSRLADTARGKILAFPTLWAKGTPVEQKRLLRTIFQHLLPTEKSLQVFYWLNEQIEAERASKNEKRDAVSNSVSLASIIPFPRVLPTVDFPAIGLNGVSVWVVVEPLLLDFSVEVPYFITRKDGSIKPPDTIGIFSIPRAEVEVRIRTLITEQNLSVSQAAKELGLSVTTVRRVCRTLLLGVYSKSADANGQRRLSRSSQAPYGRDIVQGELIANAEEQKWILKMREMDKAGESLRAIARLLNHLGIPTKNGGKWHAKTVSQILRSRSREGS